jgi:hypothetical protein
MEPWEVILIYYIILIRYHNIENLCLLILRILITPIREMQYLDWRVGMAFLLYERLPEDGTPVPKYVED